MNDRSVVKSYVIILNNGKECYVQATYIEKDALNNFITYLQESVIGRFDASQVAGIMEAKYYG